MAVTEQTRQSFINSIGPIIKRYSEKYGYQVASPIIAQACLESAYGTSQLSKKYHNYFGMKCGSKWKGKSVNMKTKEEYTVGKMTTITDFFRVYDTMEDGVKGYFDFINTNRYSNLKKCTTAETYLQTIKNDGYATASTYVKSNMTVVNKYNLTVFDDRTPVVNTYENPGTNYVRIGSTGDQVKWVQSQLNLFGYNLKVDGIYGKKTEMAVKNFQMNHNLTVDGVVGVKTIDKLRKEV